MRDKNIKIIIFIIVLGAGTIFLFSTGPKSRKYYSVDEQYSVYGECYNYTSIYCVFSFKDCRKPGRLFLYDEIEKKIIGTGKTQDIGNVEDIKWSISKNIAYFRGSESVTASNPWVLPRPINFTKE